ncbi:heme biosynthesis protein HemY [Ramlibacter sp. AW1]|uniref:Heme biosynthesis protein HemY n=1 Tax=Ramlibacter aurantiacus TaxID=2801330 RepID=A0A937D3V6_9BURK|nr:heme biosynthesis HemY N-terminal domain-containing protein [Ramlibacter aurantiacus]MBL0423109.1 heme biosynthesis protein HemY [Ramlibacter aurantiacus]
MRAALWLLALFGVAVGLALFAGNNQGTVTLFWPPWRIDLSLNLVLLLLLAGFVLLHAALRALSALFHLPRQALRWRNQQKERALHVMLVDAVAHLTAGRFLRARKAAEAALVLEESLEASGERLGHAGPLRSLLHLLAAEASQSLQDRAAREQHLRAALDQPGARDAVAMYEGTLMRAARWSLDERDAPAANAWLAELPQGAARRTLALRMKLKAARLEQQTEQALETARLLAKHRAFSPAAAHSIVRGLATDLLNQAHDMAQLQRAWSRLEPAERQMPELAIHAAQRVTAMGGEAELARQWLLPVWEGYESLPEGIKLRLVNALEEGMESIDAAWLARFESAQRANPRDPLLQYLSGMACMKRQLWGKAQQLLTQAALGLRDAQMHRKAWRALAALAEDRGDTLTAAQAWKRAASE